MAQHPTVPGDLLAFLERLYPDRAPSETDSKRAIWMRAGQAQLIRRLRDHFDKQTSTLLASPE